MRTEKQDIRWPLDDDPPHPTARWWARGNDGRLECLLCPRHCRLAEGQAGFCGSRRREGDTLVLAAYGRCSGVQVDPVEKKPLYHFLPGSRTLSLGTRGCNLDCQFCQNWHLSRDSRPREDDEPASPLTIARLALEADCRSVAFTYNDPVVFAEQAIDTAAFAHELGLRTVAVSAGYIEAPARGEFFSAMDAANIDLKAFSDDFYRRLCHARLQPVLDTLRFVARETPVWLEVTTLLIPGENDSPEELTRAAEWFVSQLGPGVPWHFTAFHPAYRMATTPHTALATLHRARDIARRMGVHHVYTGNLHDPEGSSTRCAHCGTLLIRREGFTVTLNRLSPAARCPHCHATLRGRFSG